MDFAELNRTSSEIGFCVPLFPELSNVLSSLRSSVSTSYEQYNRRSMTHLGLYTRQVSYTSY